MNSGWRVWAAGFTMAFLVGAAALVWELYRQRELEESSSARMLNTVQTVLADWNPEDLLRHAHPALLEVRSREQLENHFADLSGHGAVQSTESIEGQVFHPSLLDRHTSPVARYSIILSFERGRARIEAELIHVEGQWLFSDFKIYSSVLAS